MFPFVSMCHESWHTHTHIQQPSNCLEARATEENLKAAIPGSRYRLPVDSGGSPVYWELGSQSYG